MGRRALVRHTWPCNMMLSSAHHLKPLRRFDELSTHATTAHCEPDAFKSGSPTTVAPERFLLRFSGPMCARSA